MADPRISEFERRYQCRLLGYLGPGPGQDGFVQRSDRLTAVKFFDNAERFRREWEVYQVLTAKGIHTIAGHNVPEFIAADEQLLTLEISIVERPFILDFAGARRPDEVPDFEQHVLDEYADRLQEMFGERYATRCTSQKCFDKSRDSFFSTFILATSPFATDLISQPCPFPPAASLAPTPSPILWRLLRSGPGR